MLLLAPASPPHTYVHGQPQVRYASLPNYEEKEEDFRAESVLLRRRFTNEGEEPLRQSGGLCWAKGLCQVAYTRCIRASC